MSTDRPSPLASPLLQRAANRDGTSTARLLREAFGLTMGDAAQALGWTVSQVSTIERSEGGLWEATELRALALAAIEKREAVEETARALRSSPALLAQLVGGDGTGDAARGARVVLGHVAQGTLGRYGGGPAPSDVVGHHAPGQHHPHQLEPQPSPARTLDGADDAAPIVAGEV